MNSRGNLILLTRSNAWPSAIRRRRWPLRVSWALNIGDLMDEAARQPGSAAVIEFGADESVQQFEELAQLVNTPYHLALLAVGDHSIFRWRRLLITIGFVDVFWSTTQVGRLGELARRHFRRAAASPETLEQRIYSDLPWKAVLPES